MTLLLGVHLADCAEEWLSVERRVSYLLKTLCGVIKLLYRSQSVQVDMCEL